MPELRSFIVKYGSNFIRVYEETAADKLFKELYAENHRQKRLRCEALLDRERLKFVRTSYWEEQCLTEEFVNTVKMWKRHKDRAARHIQTLTVILDKLKEDK